MYGPHWQPRAIADDADLSNFRRNGLSDGFDGYSSLNVKRRPDTEINPEPLTAYYDVVRSIVSQKFFNATYMSGVGNPNYVEHHGHRLTFSDVTAVYNRWQLARICGKPQRIVEIGPGFGALAAHMRQLWPEAHITLVDLPDHHEVVRYYLQRTVGLEGFEITTQPPEDADLVVALRCLMEMPPEEIERYFEWIQNCPSIKFFYLISRYMKLGNILRLYPFDNRWVPLVTQYDSGSRWLHELMLYRVEDETPELRLALNTLPPWLTEDRILEVDTRLRIVGRKEG